MVNITLDDITLKNFLDKFTYLSDPNPEQKIIMSNGEFAQCLTMLKLDSTIRRLVDKNGR